VYSDQERQSAYVKVAAKAIAKGGTVESYREVAIELQCEIDEANRLLDKLLEVINGIV
jgi:hypothetical protein